MVGGNVRPVSAAAGAATGSPTGAPTGCGMGSGTAAERTYVTDMK